MNPTSNYGSNPNDQTTPNYPYQNPYPLPPQQRPLPHQRLFRWYGRQWKGRRKFLTGCVSLIVVLFACTICTAAVAGGSKGTTANTDQSTPTQIVQSTGQTSTPTPKPKPTVKPATPVSSPTPTTAPVQQDQPTQPPVNQPPPPSCNGTSVDGICYSFNASGGSLVYNPAADFCAYFSCIASFSNGIGYVIECNDAMFSKSGGRSGSCSKHGGDMRPIYQH